MMMTREEARVAVHAELRSRHLTKPLRSADLLAFCKEMQKRLEFRTQGEALSEIKTWTEPPVTKPSDVLHPGDLIYVERLTGGEGYGLRQVPEVNGAIVVMNPHSIPTASLSTLASGARQLVVQLAFEMHL